LVIGDDWAIWVDLEAKTSGDAPAQEGLSWGELAAARVIETDVGVTYVVGPTQLQASSDAVLRLAEDGSLTLLRTTTPRVGAAATWVPERGLVVAGGSDSGAGAELLAEGSDAFVPLPFPADPTEGAALVDAGEGRVLRLGAGVATVSLTLGCGSGCAPEPAGDGLALERPYAFRVADGSVLAVGGNGSGETRAMRLQDGVVTEISLREPRSGAVALALPTGHVAVVGGGKTTLELIAF
jgi:hypothetical protein